MIFNSLAFPGKIFSYRCGGDSVLGGIAKRIAEVGGMPAEQILEIFLKFVPAMAPMAMIPEPFACDYEYSALTGTFIIGYTLSMLMLFPALVLVDRYGPRFIASLGSILELHWYAFHSDCLSHELDWATEAIVAHNVHFLFLI